MINGKIYVGCASNVRTRINGHLYDLRREKHKNSYLQKACIEAGKIYNASEECKMNLIEARKKLKDIDFNIVNAHKRKSIKNIITGEVYESLAIASNTLNIPKYELSRRILGIRKNNTNLIYL
jgi:hypothetical protein